MKTSIWGEIAVHVGTYLMKALSESTDFDHIKLMSVTGLQAQLRSTDVGSMIIKALETALGRRPEVHEIGLGAMGLIGTQKCINDFSELLLTMTVTAAQMATEYPDANANRVRMQDAGRAVGAFVDAAVREFHRNNPAEHGIDDPEQLEIIAAYRKAGTEFGRMYFEFARNGAQLTNASEAALRGMQSSTPMDDSTVIFPSKGGNA